MPPTLHSLYARQEARTDEVTTILAQGVGFQLEHIASFGASSPPGFWYDQDRPEWVALLRGHASLEFEDGVLDLQPGDHLVIPRRKKHRVSGTSDDAVWVALHFEADQTAPAD